MSIVRSSVTASLSVSNKDGDVRQFPINSLTLSYGLNEIPTGHVQIGLGVSVLDPKQRSVVTQEALSYLRSKNRVKVVGRVTGEFSNKHDWYDKDVTWFDGKIAHNANQITRGAAALNVSLKHWLGDLEGSDLLVSYANNQDLVGRTSAAVSYGARPFSVNDGINLGSIGALADTANIVQDIDRFAEDIWGGAIKELLAQIMTNPLTAILDDNCVSATNRVPNKAKVALSRIQGMSTRLGKETTIPCVLETIPGQDLSNELLYSIAAEITDRPAQSFRNSDIWSLIVGYYAQIFSCRLVPRFDDAIFAPITPSYRDAYCVEVGANDIFQLDALEPMASSIRKIGISLGASAAFGLDANSIAQAAFNGVCYPNDEKSNDNETGEVRFISPPPFLRSIEMAQHQVFHELSQKRQTLGGTASVEPLDNAEADAAILKIQDQVAILAYRYAKTAYFEQKIINKTVKVVGKLRFDIAPGTMLRVRPDIDQYVGVGARPPSIQGLVTRVTIVVDASRRVASTMLQLSHVRTAEENRSDEFTTDKHPLYARTFVGAPLHDDYLNPDCEADDGS